MICVEHVRPIVKLKTKMLKSSLCDYSAAYMLVKGAIAIASAGAAAAPNIGEKK